MLLAIRAPLCRAYVRVHTDHLILRRCQSSSSSPSDSLLGKEDPGAAAAETNAGKFLDDLKKELAGRKDEIEIEQPEAPVLPYTVILTGTFYQQKLPAYKSLKKYNDPVKNVPKLASNLSQVVHSPGVHFLKDPRTHIYNFDKSFAELPHIDSLNMEKIHSFTPSSRDTKLLDIVQNIDSPEVRKSKKQSKYFSSTSSMTGVLMKFHLLLSNNRPINTTSFSKFYPETAKFSGSAEAPTSIVVSPKDEKNRIFSVDADRSTDSEITLSVLGNALELMLTKDPKSFKNYLKGSTVNVPEEQSAYHYAKIGRFTVRSQLDAYSEKLPGTGTFDIKTRAVCAIRFDLNHTDYFPTNYDITKQHGLFESFERELFDAARIVMFKYSLQARLGNMDGIFMAFHNIKRFLGFKYLPLTEIDNYFFGDYNLDGKRYGDNLLEKPPRTSYDRNEEATPEELRMITSKNQAVLNTIVGDLGNHHQDKREALSTYMADYEMRLSVLLFQKLLDTILRDTQGRPFRVMLKKVPKSSLFGKRSNSENAVEQRTTDETSSELPKEKKEKSPRRKDDDSENDVSKFSIIAVVNTLEENEHEQLQMLANERLEKSVEQIKELQEQTSLDKPSLRIKLFHRFANDYMNKFFNLNKSILTNSEKNSGFFVYQINARHIFDGVECKDRYPTPPLSALDKDSKFKWDLDYTISVLNRDADKQYLYTKLTKNIAFNTFRKNETEFDADVYVDGSVIHDHKATELQNVTRAYSQKALKRHDLFLRRNDKKGKRF